MMGKRVAGRKRMGGCCCCPAHLSYTRTLHFNADVEFRLATDQKTQSANQNINTSMSAVLFFFFFFFLQGTGGNSTGSQQVGGDDRFPIFSSAYKISHQFSETLARYITATVVLYERSSGQLLPTPRTKVPFVP